MCKEGVNEHQAMYRLALTFKGSDDDCDALIAEIERGCNTTAYLAAQIEKLSSKLREALTIALTNRFTAAPPPEHVLAKDDKLEVKLSTLNVTGLRSGSQELARHLASAAPFLCVVTETKLHSWEYKEAFVSQSCQGYERYLSSYKQITDDTKVNAKAGRLTYAARAGVMIAVRADFAKGHLVKKMVVPQELEGYLVHICFRLDASTPLHVLGVYHRGGSEWSSHHALLFSYISKQKAIIEQAGGNLIMGGDWNAVQMPQAICAVCT